MSRRTLVAGLCGAASLLAPQSLVSALGQTKVLSPVPPVVPRDIFGIIGQSNASGRGLLSELPVFANANRIKIFSNAWEWVPGAEPVDDATGQIDTVSADSPNPQASAYMAFANRLCELQGGREIGLVPCPMGGTPLNYWYRNLSRSTLYGSWLARMQEAAAAGTTKGVLMHHGEGDSDDKTEASTYGSRLHDVITDFRTDIGIADLPFFITEMHDYSGSERPYWTTVQAQQRALDGVDNIYCVSAADLTGKPGDLIHLGTAAQVTVGIRMGNRVSAELY